MTERPVGTGRRQSGRAGTLAAAVFVAAAALLAGRSAASSEVEPTPSAQPISASAIPDLRVLPTGGLRFENAALLLSGQSGGALPIAVLAVPLPAPSAPAGDPAKTQVAVVIEVDVTSLPRGAGRSPAVLPLDVALYALDPRGALLASRLETIEVPEPLPAAIERRGIGYLGVLALPPGPASLRVLVAHAPSKAVAVRVVPLEVPAGTACALAGPFSPGDAGRPLAAAPDAARLRESLGWSPPPAARPRLELGRRIRLSMSGFGALAPAAPRVLLAPAAGGAPVAVDATEVGRRPSPGAIDLDLDLDPSARSLAPGAYELAIEATCAGGAPALVPPRLLVDLLPPGDGEASWIAAAQSAQPTPAGEAGATPGGDGEGTGRWRRGEADALRARYLRALSPLARGDFAAALAAVASFEGALLSGETPATVDEVAALEGRVLRPLAERSPASLAPLLWLYRALHAEAQERGQRPLTLHAALTVGGLAELLVRAGTEPALRRIAAGSLASLAPGVARGGSTDRAEALLARASEIDPGFDLAVVLRAMDLERRGRYREVVRQLAPIAEARSDDREVALRLAINLRRIGETARARRLLSSLASSEGPAPSEPADSWVAPLASQELARLELSAGDRAAAREAIARGRARFPADDKLALLAAAHDPAAAVDLGPSGDESPRWLYGRLPERRLGELADELERGARERLPALARALESGGGR